MNPDEEHGMRGGMVQGSKDHPRKMSRDSVSCLGFSGERGGHSSYSVV